MSNAADFDILLLFCGIVAPWMYNLWCGNAYLKKELIVDWLFYTAPFIFDIELFLSLYSIYHIFPHCIFSITVFCCTL